MNSRKKINLAELYHADTSENGRTVSISGKSPGGKLITITIAFNTPMMLGYLGREIRRAAARQREAAQRAIGMMTEIAT